MKRKLFFNGKISSYLDHPGTSDTTLVFIHGNSLSSEYFETICSQDALKKYRRISIDLPGHGDSSRLSSYQLSDFSGSLIDLVRELSLEKYWLVGHSLGGHIITQALPELSPEGIFLVGTPPLKIPLDPKAFLPFPLMNLFYQEQVIEQELTELFLSLNAPEELKNIFRTTDPAVRSSIARFVSQGVYVDEESILSEYGGKLCFVVGENDDIVSSEYVREFAILHSAHFYSFAGKHHFLQHSPRSFAEFLDDFLCQNHQLVFSERDGLPVTI